MSQPAAWTAIRDELERHMSRAAFATWIADAGPVTLTGNVLQVDVPTSYAARWLTDSLQPIVERIASDKLRRPMRVTFRALDGIDDEQPAPPRESPPPALPSVGIVQGVTHGTTAGRAAVAAVERLSRADLQPGYTVLAGPAGSGRSHVLQAVAAERAGVRVVPSREWMAAIATAGATGGRRGWSEFREYRDGLARYGVLALDDLNTLPGSARKTRQELLHLCDEVCAAGGHVVVTTTNRADLRAGDQLGNRLTSAGLIQLPAPTVTAIMVRFIAMRAVPPLPADVVEDLVRRPWATPHDIEGAVRTLAAAGGSVTDRDVAEILDHSVAAATAQPDAAAQAVIHAVARETGVSVDELMGASRTSRVKLARAMAMVRLNDAGWSTTRIAAAFPGRERTGVWKAIRAFRTGG